VSSPATSLGGVCRGSARPPGIPRRTHRPGESSAVRRSRRAAYRAWAAAANVLFIDLDDFKTVNDSLGHAAGDDLLVEVGRRIRSCLRPEDTCARLGGDEFAVMIENVSGPDDAVTGAQRILGVVAEPVSILGSEVSVQGSIGIALGTGDQTTSEIMRSADLAMYRAKGEGKGRYAVYEPSMHESVLVGSLSRPISNGR
jgi:diguanylate cyclase (GGDEF)-like protein